VNSNYANQVVDGVMLSDGGMGLSRGCTPFFTMNLSGVAHMDWLELAEEAFKTVGAKMSGIAAYSKSQCSSGEYIQLRSHVCSFVRELYLRWYSDGVKVVPPDLRLTPVSIANWFMGDGHSSYLKRGNFPYSITAVFSIGSLSPYTLLEQLGSLKLLPRYYPIGSGRNARIAVQRLNTVERLFDMIRPHMVQSFLYKLKPVSSSAHSGRILTPEGTPVGGL